MSFANEKESVQDRIIKYVTEIDWEYLSREDVLRLRCGNSGIILRECFINQIQKLNPDFIDHLMCEDLIKILENITPDITGNHLVWEYLNGVKNIFVPAENRERDVKFIDIENIDRNIFHVSKEFTYTNNINTIRIDIIFFINGIPTFFVETKSPKDSQSIPKAMDQVKRYHRECPEIMTILQIYALSNLTKYCYSTTWNTSEKLLFNLKKGMWGNDFENTVKSFFDKKRIIKFLIDFILFTRKDDELKKIILRPHQMRTV